MRSVRARLCSRTSEKVPGVKEWAGVPSTRWANPTTRGVRPGRRKKEGRKPRPPPRTAYRNPRRVARGCPEPGGGKTWGRARRPRVYFTALSPLAQPCTSRARLERAAPGRWDRRPPAHKLYSYPHLAANLPNATRRHQNARQSPGTGDGGCIELESRRKGNQAPPPVLTLYCSLSPVAQHSTRRARRHQSGAAQRKLFGGKTTVAARLVTYYYVPVR